MNFKKRVNGSWHDAPHYVHNTSTDTITTLPAVLYPTGSIATVGLKGNMEQNGTPTPDSPVMPEGTGERTGNLMSFPDIAETTKNGVTYYVSGNSLYINGTSTTAFGIAIRNAFTLKAGTYTNQMYGFTGRRIYYSFNNVSATMCASDVNLFKTFTISEDTTYASALVWINNGATFNNEKIDFALFESEEPKDYEPYGYKIPISSASTTTPVYLGEVETTRKVKKLVLTGEETFGYANSCFTYTFDGKPTSVQPIKAVIFSNAYEGIEPMYRDQLRNYQCCITRNFNQIAIRDDNYTDATDFKSYLAAQYAAGTPVTVWYVLAEPETGIVNEPLRKIGEYADEVSNVATIPTITGKDTFDVDVTLKPSEVELTYTGWHDAQCKEYDGSQWV